MRRGRKILLMCAIVMFCFVMISVCAYLLMNSRDFQLFGKLVNRVETSQKTVYLTFDDGPTENTQRILNALDELYVKASFFLIGKSMEENPELTQEIIDAGHDIGSHSYSHSRLIFKPLSEIKNEVDKTNDIIRRFGYEREIFFRPPNGKKLVFLPWYLNQIGQTTVMWTLEPDSYDEVNNDADAMAQYVIDNVSDGAIILLHPMNDKTDKTLDAVTKIVTVLRDKGYSFETLSAGLRK